MNETADLLLLLGIVGIAGVAMTFFGFLPGISVGAVLAILIIAPHPNH